MGVRKYTNKLIEFADEDVISWETIARSCLSYMSEDEVEDMAISEGLLDRDDFEDEDDDEYDYEEDEDLDTYRDENGDF